MSKFKLPGYKNSVDLTVTVHYKNPPGPILVSVDKTQDEIQNISLSIQKEGHDYQPQLKVRILQLI